LHCAERRETTFAALQAELVSLIEQWDHAVGFSKVSMAKGCSRRHFMLA
jgi:hypothetical protein